MYIRYDSEGRITACSAIGGVLSGENVIQVQAGEVPEDLLETFAFGRYHVHDGRLALNPSYVPPAGGSGSDGAAPQDSGDAPAPAPERKPKKRRGGG